MKHVVMLQSEAHRLSEKTRTPLASLPDEDQSFLHLVQLAKEVELNLVLLHPDDFIDVDRFTAWGETNGDWHKLECTEVDILWDRDFRYGEERSVTRRKLADLGLPLVNPPAVNELGDNKAKAQDFIGDFLPNTLVSSGNKAAIQAGIKQLQQEPLHSDLSFDFIFCKPIAGYGGSGIVVIRPDESLDHRLFDQEETYLLQPFIETSNGIDQLGIERRHDLRIIMQDGEPLLCYARFPEGDSLLSNISQGGSIAYYDLVRVPEHFLEVAQQVQENLAKFGPSTYAIDMAQGKSGRAWVFEFNSRPGLNWTSRSEDDVKYTKFFQRKTLEFILRYCD